jgi:hypothetical protein
MCKLNLTSRYLKTRKSNQIKKKKKMIIMKRNQKGEKIKNIIKLLSLLLRGVNVLESNTAQMPADQRLAFTTKWMWHGVVVGTLNYHSGGPKIDSHPDLKCESSLIFLTHL